MNRFFITILCLFSATIIKAQIHEVGIFAGGSNFIGDVGATNYINPNEFALGLVYKWNRSPRHAWKATFTSAKLTGSDDQSNASSRKERNYDFENTVKELTLGLEFNFFDFDLHSLDRQFTPYVFLGISYFRYDSQYVSDSVTRVDEKNNSFALPMVVGVKTSITPKLVLGFEVGARYTLVDDIDGSFPKNEEFKNLRFGNINSNDWYVFTGFTLTYTFGNRPCFCPL